MESYWFGAVPIKSMPLFVFIGFAGGSLSHALHRCAKVTRTKCLGNTGLLQSHKHTAVCSRAAASSTAHPLSSLMRSWQKGLDLIWILKCQMEEMFVFPFASHSRDMCQIPWREMWASSCFPYKFPGGKVWAGDTLSLASGITKTVSCWRPLARGRSGPSHPWHPAAGLWAPCGASELFWVGAQSHAHRRHHCPSAGSLTVTLRCTGFGNQGTGQRTGRE